MFDISFVCKFIFELFTRCSWILRSMQYYHGKYYILFIRNIRFYTWYELLWEGSSFSLICVSCMCTSLSLFPYITLKCSIPTKMHVNPISSFPFPWVFNFWFIKACLMTLYHKYLYIIQRQRLVLVSPYSQNFHLQIINGSEG